MKSANETIMFLIDHVKGCLEEINTESNEFVLGEKHAYVECLEIIQDIWQNAKSKGLDFDIEKRFPLR